MGDNDKKELVEKLLSSSYLLDAIRAEELLWEALMKDSPEGKLYKYRECNEYSRDNLMNGTLYCATPDSFNDPFDCKIGVTLNSFYTAKYSTEFKFLEDVLIKFYNAVINNDCIETCNENEKRIIARLLSNECYIEFVEKISKGKSEKMDTDFLKENLNLLLEMLGTALEDEWFRERLGAGKELLPRIDAKDAFSESGDLLSEKKIFEKYVKANGVNEDADADEIDLVMLLCNNLFPNKKDEVELIRSDLDKMGNSISEKFNHLFRVGCLATDYKNRLMWSHYANGHKGFCVEYDYLQRSDSLKECVPLPVIYSDERPLIPWEVALDNNKENTDKLFEQLRRTLLTKDSVWSYENEWRIIISGSSSGNIAMPPISAVYLGTDMIQEEKEQIIKIAKQKGIRVKQMVKDRGSYELHAREVI